MGYVIGILGAGGGAGASCLAVGLGVRLASGGASCVVVDGRPAGAGLDVVAGCDDLPGVRWGDLARVRGAVAAGIVERLPSPSRGLAVLAHDRLPCPVPGEVPGAVARALADTAQVCLVDLDRPGGWGAPLWDVLDELVVVVPAHVVGLAAAARVVPVASGAVPCTSVLVRAVPGARRTGHEVADVLTSRLGVPSLGVLPDDPRVPAALAAGRPPGGHGGPFARECSRLVAGFDVAEAAA